MGWLILIWNMGKHSRNQHIGIDEPTGSWVMLPEDLGRCGCAFWGAWFWVPWKDFKTNKIHEIWCLIHRQHAISCSFQVPERWSSSQRDCRVVNIHPILFLGGSLSFHPMPGEGHFLQNLSGRELELPQLLSLREEPCSSWWDKSEFPSSFKLLCDDMSLPGNGD